MLWYNAVQESQHARLYGEPNHPFWYYGGLYNRKISGRSSQNRATSRLVIPQTAKLGMQFMQKNNLLSKNPQGSGGVGPMNKVTPCHCMKGLGDKDDISNKTENMTENDVCESTFSDYNYCPTGCYTVTTGYNHDITCKPAPAGKYPINCGKNAPGSSPGTNCPAVAVCPSGTYCPGGKRYPTECPSGTYQDQSGQSLCKLCPADTYNDLSGQTSKSSCKNCTAGYVPNKDGTSCFVCPAGTYADTSKCSPCATGSYSHAGSSDCSLCPPKTYQDKTGQTSCQDCSRGTYLTGETSCPSNATECPQRTKCNTKDGNDGCWFKSPNSNNFYCCPSGNNHYSDGCTDASEVCYIDSSDATGCLAEKFPIKCAPGHSPPTPTPYYEGLGCLSNYDISYTDISFKVCTQHAIDNHKMYMAYNTTKTPSHCYISNTPPTKIPGCPGEKQYTLGFRPPPSV